MSYLCKWQYLSTKATVYLCRGRCPAPRFPQISPLSPGISAQLQGFCTSKALCTVRSWTCPGMGHPRHSWAGISSWKSPERDMDTTESTLVFQHAAGKCNCLPQETKWSRIIFFRKYSSDFLPALHLLPHSWYLPWIYADSCLRGSRMKQRDLQMVLSACWGISILQVPWKA